jgi:muramidase (phage lysozyme)
MADWESAPVAIDDNTRKFLDFLGKAEGADYNTIVGGKSFDSYAAHPDVVGLRTKDGPSTAAGRYQITKTTYDDVAPKLGISDFSPQSQDLIALELIKRNGALKDVQSGDYQKAISKLGGTWASLPSSPYAQPKRSQGWVEKTVLSMMPSANATDMANVQAKAAPKADDGWESATPAAPKNDAGWESATPQAAPAPTPTPTPAPAVVPSSPQTTPANQQDAPLDYKQLGKKALRAVDDAVRGAADTLTFGYADEIAAKMDQLTGRAKSYDDALKAQRARDAEGGAARLTGQVAGALLPTGVVVRGMDSGSRLVRAGAGAATGALQGGLYGAGSAEDGNRLEGAQEGAALGALTGGVLGGILPATVQQKGSAFIKKAGGNEAARLDAEIVQDLAKISENPTMRGGKVQAVQANALESKYVNDVQNAIKGMGKDELQKLGVSGQDLNAAVQGRKILTPDELQGLRSNPVGLALADAIEKAQRTRSLTAANPADNNILVKGARVAADWTLPGFLSKPINYMLNNRKSREEVIQGALKNQEAAGNVLERLGPSQATQSLENLQKLAQQAQTGRQAQIAANQTVSAQKKADKAAELLAKQQAEAQAALDAARGKTLANANKATQQFLTTNADNLVAQRTAQEAEQAALEQARMGTLANANQAGQAANQQTAAQLLAQREAQAQQAAAIEAARGNTLASANNAGQAAREANTQGLLAERGAQAQLDAARSQTLANANAAGDAARAANTNGILAERQAGTSAMSAATAEQAALEKAREETLRKANQASLDNMKKTQAKLRAEGKAADDGAAAAVTLARWSEGKTANGGVQGTITEWTGLSGKNLVNGIEEIGKQYPQLLPHLEKIKSNQPVSNVKTLGVIQDALSDWAAGAGIKVEASTLKKQAVDAGVAGAKSVPDSLYKKASGIVSSLDDGALSSLIGKEAAASGDAIAKPRSYATGKLAKILHDQAEGRALDAEAQGILQMFMK